MVGLAGVVVVGLVLIVGLSRSRASEVLVAFAESGSLDANGLARGEGLVRVVPDDVLAPRET